MLHLISTKVELWQNGAMVRGQSDPEHKNTASVWITLSKTHFVDQISHSWAWVFRV